MDVIDELSDKLNKTEVQKSKLELKAKEVNCQVTVLTLNTQKFKSLVKILCKKKKKMWRRYLTIIDGK